MKKSKNIFRVKNGRKFFFALNKAGRDSNTHMMFLDNVDGTPLTHFIEDGQFKIAVIIAFTWEDSNEGYKFWDEVADNIKDIK